MLRAVATKPHQHASDLVQPVAHETRDRIITGLVTGVPFLLLGVAAWQLWNQAFRWSAAVVLAILYVATGLGITVGFHRLLTHRSFKTTKLDRKSTRLNSSHVKISYDVFCL